MSSTTDRRPAAVSESLSLFVNGQQTTSSATSLAGLLLETGYGETKVATARNGDFVPEPLRAATALADGDRIEILSPRQGG